MDERSIETAYLEDVIARLKVYKERVFAQKEKVDAAVEYGLKHFDNDNAEQFTELTLNSDLQSGLAQKAKSVVRAIDKPYFTRVDFIAADEAELGAQKYYIGKMSLFRDEDDSPAVVDWRAPVSNLYYEGRLGKAEYDSPDGLITGEITLKRQYVIESGELKDFFDIDITASDDFLQAALGGSKDKRLKDIVSTIQAEQNRVIRAPMIKTLIVQGAAGSGKTTIALHRIAYLLYHHADRLSPKNIMILAPNKFFISYISDVLPDLGVEQVLQTTWEDFAKEFTDENLNVKPAVEKLAYMMENPGRFGVLAAVSRIKGSLRFKAVADKFLDNVLADLFPKEDFSIDGRTLIKRGELKKMLREDYAFLPVAKRLKEIRKYLVNALKRELPHILANINNECDRKISRLKEEYMVDTDERRRWIGKIFDLRDERLKKISNKSKTAVNDYMKKTALLTAGEYYKKLVTEAETFVKAAKGIFAEKESAAIIKATGNAVAGGYWEEEDVAPIVYIHNALYGNEWFDLRHVVIDEAQDMSPYQFAALKAITKSNSFSILGDLRQGIFEHKGVSDWETVSEIFPESDYVTMAQSYRTTVEIMDCANVASDKMTIKSEAPKARPVIRHGETVRFINTAGLADTAEVTKKVIKGYKEKGFNSIAVICATMRECRELYPLLGGETALLTGKETEYGGAVTLLPAYLAKGLEFDGVIIADASSEKYEKEREIDIKTLYVAATRALHELTILHGGEITNILK